MRVVQKALTFDDVSIIPAHSIVLPRDVSLKTRLTRTIQAEHPAGFRRHGHRHGSAAGDRARAGGRHWRHPQEHVAESPGQPGSQGQALRERHGKGSHYHCAVHERARGADADPHPQDLRTPCRRRATGCRDRHQPRPALRDQSRPTGAKHHDPTRSSRHGQGRCKPGTSPGADAQAPAGACAGGQ